MAEVVRQNMAEGQKRQKEWYDKEARLREFEVGDSHGVGTTPNINEQTSCKVARALSNY